MDGGAVVYVGVVVYLLGLISGWLLWGLPEGLRAAREREQREAEELERRHHLPG